MEKKHMSEEEIAADVQYFGCDDRKLTEWSYHRALPIASAASAVLAAATWFRTGGNRLEEIAMTCAVIAFALAVVIAVRMKEFHAGRAVMAGKYLLSVGREYRIQNGRLIRTDYNVFFYHVCRITPWRVIVEGETMKITGKEKVIDKGVCRVSLPRIFLSDEKLMEVLKSAG